ncbi:astacin [Ancylostoma caninum]|uniref:Zinc metalloproteinase n=1 Tax=Ancylostoma caninum TaxID=29170 RepID=A0A368G7J9_ANCCA|nr:astacin [Ancylostoma caninum]
MRVLFLVLLLALCANAGFFDSKIGQKIKETLSKMKAALNGTALIAIREKFNSLKEKIKAKLTLSPARKAILDEIMKHIKFIKKDKVQEKGDSIEEINENSKIGELLYQGDIVLTNKQAEEIVQDIESSDSDREKRQAFRDKNYPKTLWSKGVYYYFHYNATPEVRSVFKKGANLWMKDTCIDFFESQSAHDRIRVFKEDGCWSYVGRLGGEQDLSLGDGCESVGTAAHEIGHAIGFFHTQSRHDRDNFITFNAHNVKRDWLDQFTKQTKATNENYGITYDYGSIMHYGANRSHNFVENAKFLSIYWFRFCAPEDVGTTLVSSSNIVPIITYNRFFATTVDIQYRIVSGGSGGKPMPQPQTNCVDNAQCATIVRTKDFCHNRAFTDSIRRGLCPKACGFCR